MYGSPRWRLPSVERLALLERLSGLVLALNLEHPARVAVDGPDAAGKTTLADELAVRARRSGCTVIRASIDAFHRPRSDRYARATESPEGYYLDSFNHESLRMSLLEPLGPSGTRWYRTAVYDCDADRPVHVEPRRALPDDILLFDGVFLMRPELDAYWDLRIYVHVSPRTSLARAIERDRHLGETSAVIARYRQRYLPGQTLYRQTANPIERADLIVVNDDPVNPVISREADGSASLPDPI